MYQINNLTTLENNGTIHFTLTPSTNPYLLQLNLLNYGEIHIFRASLRIQTTYTCVQYGKFFIYPGAQMQLSGYLTFADGSLIGSLLRCSEKLIYIEGTDGILKLLGGTLNVNGIVNVKTVIIESNPIFSVYSSNFTTQNITFTGGTFYIFTQLQVPYMSISGAAGLNIDINGNLTILNTMAISDTPYFNFGQVRRGTLMLASACQTTVTGSPCNTLPLHK